VLFDGGAAKTVMSKRDPIADVPTPDEVRAALERIVVSDVFSTSPQLNSFLSFVVEAVLHGKSDRIKGYTIAVEVLRRDIKFDPQLDPIVRVEATRLRRALERYYAGPGLTDSVIIGLPRGSYVPTFGYRREILDNPDTAPVPRPTASRGIWFAGALLVMVAAAVVAWVVFAQRSGAPDQTAGPADTQPLRPGNGMPTLVVQDFQIVGTPDPRAPSAVNLFEKLRDTSSRFDAINIATDKPPGAAGTADYRLSGFIDYLDDDTTNVRFSLLDAHEGVVVWTRSFDRLPVARDRVAQEDSIAAEVATALLQPFGLIRSRERTKYLGSSQGDPRYRCLLLTSDAFRSFTSDESARARECLERLTARDPGFGDGFSYLAALNNREFVYGFGKGADDPRTLDSALLLARRGIELNPNSARAWQVLSTVLFSRHDTVAAFAAVEKAVALNKYDQIIVGEYGGRLITNGEIERGMTVLQSAAGDGGVRPSWHHFYFFLGHFMRGQLPEATHEADEMTTDSYTHGLFARALMAATNGDMDKARSTWAKLVAIRSAWRDNPRGELDKYIFAPEILNRLLRDLVATGLTTTK
jgi:tetratricopeptide (TPR) repeat protein